MTDGVVLRPGRDDDADDIIALIDRCWAEYPGCVMDVDGELPELRALASYYESSGGRLWVAERQGRVVGMAAVKPAGDGAWEMCKVYLDAALRGTSVAHDLLATAEDHARHAGAQQVLLWTDTRFTRAHVFYAKRSYVRQGAIRALHDLSNSLEYHYTKPLRGTVAKVLDAAAAATAERRLAAVLSACAEAGTATPFFAPVPADRLAAYWQSVSAEVARGTRILIAAWHEGTLLGSVQLDLGLPETQAHRAEMTTLLLHPAAPGDAMTRALVERAEAAALAVGCRLATACLRADAGSGAVFRALGYREVGRIPGYELGADRTPRDGISLWKMIG